MNIKYIRCHFFILLFTAVIACNNPTDKKAKEQPAEKPVPAYILTLKQSVEHYPDSTGLRLQYIYALDSIAEFKTAIAQTDSLIKKDTANYGIWYARGQVMEDAGDTTGAMHSYSKAINVYPAPDALLSLANLYAEAKNNKALLLCSRVKEMSLGRSFDANSDFIAGVYYARTGNRQQALQLFDRCIASDFTYMTAYIEKGLVYFDNKQYQEALKVFQFASTVNNLYADAYYYMARCYEMTGQKDSALNRFQQALQLDKNLTQASEGIERVKDK